MVRSPVHDKLSLIHCSPLGSAPGRLGPSCSTPLHAAVALVLVNGWASSVWAQPREADAAQQSQPAGQRQAAERQQPATAGPVIVAPKLLHFQQAVYPAAELERGQSARVVLQLEIGADGAVRSATIVESASPAFDAAALAAVQQFVFAPAMRDGVPIAAKINYLYQFEPRLEAVAITSYVGGVFDAVTGQPVAGAVVELSSGDQQLRQTTDGGGKFDFGDAPSGTVQLQVTAPGYELYVAADSLNVGELKEVKLSLIPLIEADAQEQAIEIEVRGIRPSTPTVVRQLQQQEMRRIPGTFGDALRSIQSLPGVARTPSLSGLLIVRGTSEESTQVFFQGVLTPHIFHFGGLSSVVPTEMLESIDFMPGNYGARFGRGLGGVVDAKIRRSNEDGRFHGLMQLDFIDARAIFEGPVFDTGWNFMGGVRRSHLDAWLGPLVDGYNTGFDQLPVYYDYQLFVDRRTPSGTYFRFGIHGADDSLRVISDESILLSNFQERDVFWNIISEFETHLGPNTSWHHASSFGRLIERIDVGPLRASTNALTMTFRGDLTHQFSKALTLRAGPDLLYAPFDLGLTVTEEDVVGDATTPSPLGRPPRVSDSQAAFFQPAIYSELEADLTRRWEVIAGLRLDYTKGTGLFDLSPRVNTRYALAPDYPKTELKAAAGLYLEPPEPRFTLPEYGSTSLKTHRSAQFAVGIEQELSRQIEASAEGFYSKLDKLLSRGATPEGAQYNNAGEGDVIGAEFMLRYRPDDRFFGWASYTLARSMRRFAPGLPREFFYADQTHVGAVLGSYRLGKGWEVGGRFRFSSGNLTQPCGQELFSTSDGAVVCLPGGRDEERDKWFHQLDLRVEKQWRIGDDFRFTGYLDVINVYNRQQADLPFVPSLGLRGEF